MKLEGFFRKNHKRILVVNGLVFVGTLASMAILNGIPGMGQITAFSVGIDGAGSGSAINMVNGSIFSLFVMNLLSVALLFKVYNPQKYLIGPKIKTYASNKAITSEFVRSVIKAHSKLTDKEYTMFILDNLKNNNLKKHPDLKFVSLHLGPHSPKVEVDPEINSMSSKKVRSLFQLMIDELTESKSEEEQESFKTILRYSMSQKLLTALNDMGIIV